LGHPDGSNSKELAHAKIRDKNKGEIQRIILWLLNHQSFTSMLGSLQHMSSKFGSLLRLLLNIETETILLQTKHIHWIRRIFRIWRTSRRKGWDK